MSYELNPLARGRRGLAKAAPRRTLRARGAFLLFPRRVRKTKKRPDHHTATPSPACDLVAGADVNARSQWWTGGFGRLHTADPELAAYAIERRAVVDVHAAARLDQSIRVLGFDPQTEIITRWIP